MLRAHFELYRRLFKDKSIAISLSYMKDPYSHVILVILQSKIIKKSMSRHRNSKD